MAREPLTPELVVRGYCLGAFPMARSRTGKIEWYRPDPRAILPLDRFHVRRSLAKRVRNGGFRITLDAAFERVMAACSEPGQPGTAREDTWISPEIARVYTELHRLGVAHSVEAWHDGPEGDRLVGGLYGVALGSAFFGESMFSREKDASKVCLVHLVEHLRARGYTLLDVQFVNPHLVQFGVEEIPNEEYLQRLAEALEADVTWS